MKARASNARTKKIGSVAAVADRAEAASGRTPRAEASTPCAALQTQIDRSPRMLTQRRTMQSALGSTSSREADRRTEVPRDRVDGAPVRQASMVDGGVLPAASSVAVGPAVSAASAAPAQVDEAQPNRTGLPNQLKAGIERLSGMDMSAVRVHRNSDKPAQLSALAYAQGNHIHLRSGQERHLPHEA